MAQPAPTPTLLQHPHITTPTPVGGVQSPPSQVIIPTLTLTLPAPAGEVTETASATMTPAAMSPVGSPAPSATPQRLVVAGKETAQPLLDTAAMQLSSRSTTTPNATGPTRQAPDARLVRLLSILGGATLVAAALLGVIAVLVWRLHSR